jgi:uncharacterized membrane protein YeaQ/YmgE (transglycosylase-associated protein family)
VETVDSIVIDYAGMNAAVLGAWLLIATAAGVAARRIVKGRKIIGLWGDAVIGMIGIFLVGTLLRSVGVDLSVTLFSLQPDSWTFNAAVWVDILLTALLGAFLIRAVLSPFAGKGG